MTKEKEDNTEKNPFDKCKYITTKPVYIKVGWFRKKLVGSATYGVYEDKERKYEVTECHISKRYL